MKSINWKAFILCLFFHILCCGVVTSVFSPTWPEFVIRMTFWTAGGISFGLAFNSARILFKKEEVTDIKTAVQ